VLLRSTAVRLSSARDACMAEDTGTRAGFPQARPCHTFRQTSDGRGAGLKLSLRPVELLGLNVNSDCGVGRGVD
jgi:hypothetical protein